MFMISGTVAAILCAVFEIFIYNKKRTVSYCIATVFKNVLVVNLFTALIFKVVLRYQHFIYTKDYNWTSGVKFFAVGLFVGFVFIGLTALLNTQLTIEKDEIKRKKGARFLQILSTILFFLGNMAYFGTKWGRDEFGKVTGDQFLINLTSPTEGTEASVYYNGFEGPVFYSLLLTTVFAIVLFTCFKLVLEFRKKGKVTVLSDFFKRLTCYCLALVFLCFGFSYSIKKFQLDMVFNAYVLKSDFIEENYSDPKTVDIKWPEKKRNLIHIYLESMENSFLSKDLGGFMDENLIPNLTELAKTGTVFSDTEQFFGGPLPGTGTQWSIASMVNQMTGLPMKAPGWRNSYGTDGKFLPGAYTIGELLEEQGYEQTCMIGANGKFGNLRYLFKSHGNWTFFDYKYAKNHKLIPQDYKVWWGFEDDKLYEFAKDEITRLYNTGKPFNFTVENADTHRPDGYVSPGKEKPYQLPYANAIWNSDKDVTEFIKWIQNQPFYENTTIVLIGDHLSMDTAFFKDAKFTKDYHRSQFNCIINPAPSVGKPSADITTKREWANWDYFPTIIASIGGEIEGERLGIGTNLFSGKETIYEEFGVDYVDNELEKGSEFYNTTILGVDDLNNAASNGIKKKDKTKSKA